MKIWRFTNTMGLLRYKLTACVIVRNEAIQAIYLIWIASFLKQVQDRLNLLAMTGFANLVILIHNNPFESL